MERLSSKMSNNIQVFFQYPGPNDIGASIPSWGTMLILSVLLAMGVRGYAEATKSSGTTGKRSNMSLLMNPAEIITIAGEAVVDRVDKLFGDVMEVGKELGDSVSIIKQTLVSLSTLLRTFFKMATSFVISFQRMLQGLLGSALNLLTVIKGLLSSLMDTMTVLVYTIKSAMNLVGSVDNGPPGHAMRAMIDVINAL